MSKFILNFYINNIILLIMKKNLFLGYSQKKTKIIDKFRRILRIKQKIDCEFLFENNFDRTEVNFLSEIK